MATSTPLTTTTTTNTDLAPDRDRRDDVPAAAELFRALSSPLRIRLLLALDEPTPVGRLVEVTGSSQPLVSQHLRVLRGANLVTVTRVGREVRYAVADQHIRHLIEDGLAHAAEGASVRTRPSAG